MAAWRKSALLCGIVWVAGVVLVGCSKTEAPTTAAPPPAPTPKISKGNAARGGGGTVDINDYPAPSGAKTGDFTGGLGKRR